MISSLTGVVEHVGLDSAVINVNGVGYLVSATPGTLAGMRLGEETKVYTEFIVREDAQTLYAFADASEREVFNALITVNGIGPRIGLAVLSIHDPEAVRLAIASNDEKALTTVPGIGPKTARRIILDLTGKLVPTELPAGDAATPGAAAEGSAPSAEAADAVWREQVLEALTGLGWTEKDATRALDATLKADPALTDAPDVAQILRATLRDLGQSHSQTRTTARS